MTAFTEFFCDYCNPGGERRDEGREDPSGYARELFGHYPLGWWDVPHKGPGGEDGHACPKCVLGRSDVREDIASRRGLETKRLLGELGDDDVKVEIAQRDHVILDKDGLESDDPAPDWPSRTSPFGG